MNLENYTPLELILSLLVYVFIGIFTFYKQKQVEDSYAEKDSNYIFVVCFFLGVLWVLTIPVYLGKRLIGNWKE